MNRSILRAPFPYFGGKRLIASAAWDALGDVAHYIEPFAGSLAVLLARPHRPRLETVNDADGLLVNAWRAIARDPDAVAEHADWPVSEPDLHARHVWLVERRESLTDRLSGDPDWHDAKAAGWWVWGVSCWIGSGWCSGKGPWWPVDGALANVGAGTGVTRNLPHLGDAGRGVNRKLPLSSAGTGVNGQGAAIRDWMRALSARLRDVRIACGDWSRVCGPSVLRAGCAPVGILLDPPYADGYDVYSAGSGKALWRAVCAYAAEVGAVASNRVVLCGYDGTFDPPPGWRTVEWKARGGLRVSGRWRRPGERRARAAVAFPSLFAIAGRFCIQFVLMEGFSMGRLFLIRGAIYLDCYYWSESGNPPDEEHQEGILQEAYQTESPFPESNYCEAVSEASPQDMDSLVYGDHKGDLSLRQALERQAMGELFQQEADRESRLQIQLPFGDGEARQSV